MLKGLIFAAVLAICAPAAHAQPDIYNSSKVVTRSSATIVVTWVSTSAFTRVDLPVMNGSDYIIVQSTYAEGSFGCSNEVSASSMTSVAGNPGMIRAKPILGAFFNGATLGWQPRVVFWEMEFRRWYQNLPVYCTGSDTNNTSGFRLEVRQSK